MVTVKRRLQMLPFSLLQLHILSAPGEPERRVMKSPAGSFSTEGYGEKSVNANEWLDYRSCLERHHSPNYTAQKEKSCGPDDHLNPSTVALPHFTRQVTCYEFQRFHIAHAAEHSPHEGIQSYPFRILQV